MLKITIPAYEQYNDETNEFIVIKEQSFHLEHSLVSLSKWESKWRKPFLTKESKTVEESIDYIRCMTITQNVDPASYAGITLENLNEVTEYIDAPMTAAVFPNTKKTINREIVTAEIIYFLMISMNIPFECQKWHLNRLITLINVCNIKNQPPSKVNKKELMNRNADLNAARKRELNTNG